MNAEASKAGQPPAADSDTIVALASDIYWLATGAPTGDQHMAGAGAASWPRLVITQNCGHEAAPTRSA